MPVSRDPVSLPWFHKLHVSIFSLLLIITGIVFFLAPKQKISADEKRKLTPFPSFTYSKLFNSQYTDSIDLFYSDNFICRNQMISLASKWKKMRGFHTSEIKYYTAAPAKQSKTNVNENSGGQEQPLNLEADLPSDMPYESIKSIIIANKRAVQMFGGLKSAAENYAGLINLYKQTFKDTMKLYCMAAPVGSDLFLPAKINKLKEREFIEYFYNKIGNNATCVLAYDEIRKHKNEYIQFNTDHHWTGLGAYYAYVAFCKAAGFSPVPLEKMTRKVIPNFLGTLYYQTRAEELKENIDSVVYHKIPYETQVTYFKTGYTNGYKGSLYAEMARGGNSYGVFLGSDYPLMRVISPNKNGRKILVFKDSYGNAFSPYLASHYQEVFIVDYRHFNANICELVRTYGITDIIFAHNVYVYNSGYTISREKELLNGFKQNSIKNKIEAVQ